MFFHLQHVQDSDCASAETYPAMRPSLLFFVFIHYLIYLTETDMHFHVLGKMSLGKVDFVFISLRKTLEDAPKGF